MSFCGRKESNVMRLNMTPDDVESDIDFLKRGNSNHVPTSRIVTSGTWDASSGHNRRPCWPVQSGEPPAPPEWFLRVQEDLRFAWKTVALVASAPPPDLEASFWIGVMRDKGRCSQVLKSVHFFESALDDRAAAKRTVAATLVQ